jgi:hypothetical protein
MRDVTRRLSHIEWKPAFAETHIGNTSCWLMRIFVAALRLTLSCFTIRLTGQLVRVSLYESGKVTVTPKPVTSFPVTLRVHTLIATDVRPRRWIVDVYAVTDSIATASEQG